MTNHSQREHHHAQHDRDRRQQAPDVDQTPLQRCRTGPAVQQSGDAAGGAGGTDRGDHRGAPALDDDGAGRQVVVSVHGFVDRQRFPGQRRLVDHQGGGLDDRRVRGDDVPLPEHDDIAHHHLGRRYPPLLAITDHPCRRRGQLLQRRDGLLGTDLLADADRGVDHDDQRDDRRIGPVPGRHREGHGDQQHQDQRVPQLPQYPSPPRRRRPPRHGVGAVASPPPSRFGRRQALRQCPRHVGTGHRATPFRPDLS
ncbi:Uncharacterised protein [Nocardia africana]|uniref:Uncharacterized protein n=1 Tax=Nocardia africana TaxID=134964 RepID=A0A378WW86_9NOCA|nr:Uncharacterised protein [Nocardia africana]